VRCQACGADRTPADRSKPGLCECGSPRYLRLECAECPRVRLGAAMASGPGALLQRVLELDTLLQLPGMALTMNDLDIEEWNALQVLWSERDREQKRNRA
jgi:hypothetical protein